MNGGPAHGHLKRGTTGDHVAPPDEDDLEPRPLLPEPNVYLGAARLAHVPAPMPPPGPEKALDARTYFAEITSVLARGL